MLAYLMLFFLKLYLAGGIGVIIYKIAQDPKEFFK